VVTADKREINLIIRAECFRLEIDYRFYGCLKYLLKSTP
jgi:hypothetical protein